MHRAFIVALAAVSLGACTYAVKPTSAPAVNIYTTFESKIPGRWALVVEDGGSMNRQITMGSYACSAHTYPFDGTESLATSTRSTLQQVFEAVESRSSAPTREQMQADGLAGVILVRVDTFQPRATCTQSFWTMNCTSNVELSLGVRIDGLEESLFASSVGSQRSADGDAGGACGNVPNVVADAYRNTLRDTMERLAERVGGAPKLRGK